MELELEYVITDEESDDDSIDWIHTYSYAPVFAFDYYTGDIYHETTVSDGKLILLDTVKDSKETKNKDKKKT